MDDYQDYDLAIAEAERKRKLAQALMAQGQEPMSGQMISGHYVAPNVTQGLAKMLQSYVGGRSSSEAGDEIKALRQGQQDQRQNWINQMPQARPNYSDMGPQVPATPTAEDYTQWAVRGTNIDPKAAQMGLNSANIALNRESQAQSRADQMQLRKDQAEAQRQLQLQLAQMRQQNGNNPYFQALPTEQGYMRFNARTGQMEPIAINGGSVLPAAQSPSLQGQIAGSKAGAQVMGKETAEANLQLPSVIAKGEQTIQLVDDLLKHPGFSQAVGASRMMGFQKIPGTQAYDFETRLKQLQGQQFLQAFETLKGGGQITEVEGAKATQAIARMDAAQSEKEFKDAAQEFKNIIKAGLSRAQQKAAGGASATPMLTQQSAPKRIKYDAQGNPLP